METLTDAPPLSSIPKAPEPVFMDENPFKIEAFCPIAITTFNVSNEMCMICREDLMAPSKTTEASDDNHAIEGKCGHAFHSRCINNWLAPTKGQGVCPTCSTTWNMTHNTSLDTHSFSQFLKKIQMKK